MVRFFFTIKDNAEYPTRLYDGKKALQIKSTSTFHTIRHFINACTAKYLGTKEKF